ncbi:MAG: hypothetical protein IPI49_23265 [Myxococcales bacterium]|nr:hypothetical protein [Myxococcales bacterium]
MSWCRSSSSSDAAAATRRCGSLRGSLRGSLVPASLVPASLVLASLAGSAVAAPSSHRSGASGPSSIAAFEHATEAARQPGSGAGQVVTRAELRNAIGFFLHDDGAVDAGERGHLGACLSDPGWTDGLTGPAIHYATAFAALYTDAAVALVAMDDIQAPLVDLLGAPGALTSSVWIQEGRVTSAGGVLSQASLRAAYDRGFRSNVSTFDPINVRELANELSGRLELGMPTQDEVDGALAYLTQGPRPAAQLYLASWITANRDGAPGDIGGVVVAAVSADRRFVRFIEVHVWGE